MELKNFAKKLAVAALIGSFAFGTLTACSSSDKSSTTSMSKTTDANGKTVRSKTSTYSTK